MVFAGVESTMTGVVVMVVFAGVESTMTGVVVMVVFAGVESTSHAGDAGFRENAALPPRLLRPGAEGPSKIKPHFARVQRLVRLGNSVTCRRAARSTAPSPTRLSDGSSSASAAAKCVDRS
jgi:hypothetical protein